MEEIKAEHTRCEQGRKEGASSKQEKIKYEIASVGLQPRF